MLEKEVFAAKIPKTISRNFPVPNRDPRQIEALPLNQVPFGHFNPFWLQTERILPLLLVIMIIIFEIRSCTQHLVFGAFFVFF